MEIEQEKSKFQIRESFFAQDNDLSNLYQKILSNSYQLLDNLSGGSTQFLPNNDFSMLFGSCDFYRAIKLLQEIGFLSWFNFRDERYNDAPFFFESFVAPSYPDGVTDSKPNIKTIGRGFSKNQQIVFGRMLGEFLERYFLTLYHKKNLLRGSLNSLKRSKNSALDLNLLAGFSNEQKTANPKLQFNNDSFFFWEKIKRFSTGKDTYAPAQLVYWSYAPGDLEPVLQERNTNGAGGMFTKEGAILAGLYELVQRDSFLIHWLNCLTPARINPHTVPHQEFQILLEESERYGFEIICLDITTDTKIPAVVVILADKNGVWPCYSLGGGCDANPAKALFRALEEAWSVYYWLRPKSPLAALSNDYLPFSKNIGQNERLRLWANPEMAKHLEFFITGAEKNFSDTKFDFPNRFSSIKEELDFAVKTIENLGSGYEVYYYEARHSILKKIKYHSAQVIVPQLIPLYLFEQHAFLGARRLKEVPSKIGFKAAGKLNTLPHLFP